MRKNIVALIISLVFACLLPAAGLTCTTFVLDNDGQTLYGKNMDWSPLVSYALVNKRGVVKTSMPVPQEPDSKPITWISQFGSVTLNLFSREMPYEGRNEAGLFISTSGLFNDTEYPAPDLRPVFNGFQWVQYQLDNFSTVDEVIASDQTVRIQTGIGVHYLACDSTGNCASLEWIDGSLVCHSGKDMPYKILADSAYDESVDYLSRFRGFGGFRSIPHPVFYRPSLIRFAIAADMIQKYSPPDSGPAVDYAFRILQDIVINPFFQPAIWSAVYDIANKKIYFRTRDNKKIRWFDFSNFDFSCVTPVKALKMQSYLSGDVTESFVDHTKDMDIEMLEMWNLTDEDIDYFSTYSEKYTYCTEDTDNKYGHED